MNIHIIACQVLYRELSYLAAVCGNPTTVTWMPQGLHDTPDKLRAAVAAEIARVETAAAEGTLKRNPDRIALGYGLCSNGLAGIESGELPLIIPRTDDCIGLFLGSQRRYLELFRSYPGIYWMNNGWLESAFLPTAENYAALRGEYAERYGEDNADFLMENETGWIRNYRTCGYIQSEVFQSAGYEGKARSIAGECGWETVVFAGQNRLLRLLLEGDCPEEEFLLCPPRHRIVPTYDEKKLAAIPL